MSTQTKRFTLEMDFRSNCNENRSLFQPTLIVDTIVERMFILADTTHKRLRSLIYA